MRRSPASHFTGATPGAPPSPAIKEADMPRKRKGSDTVHFCRNCSNWPTSDYIESNSGERCNECLGKRNQGNCTAG